MMKRFGIFLLVSVAAVTFIAGFAGRASAEEPRYGGILKSVTTWTPRSIGWPSGGAPPRLPNYFLCMETLLRVDDNGKPAPHLVTSWKYSSDYKNLTLKLRKGVKFHDGSDFNANAVKMNIEERKSGGIVGKRLRDIESIDIIDENTVRLNLSRYKNSLLYQFADFNGLMVSPKVIEKATTKEGKKWAARNPVGTGPFKFVKFERNVILKAEKFDGYWQKGKPYLDGIEMHYIFDPMTSMSALRAGEVHTWWEVPVDKVAELKKHGFEVLNYAARSRALAGDSANPQSIYADKRVREALEYALDKPAISKALGYGYWEPMNQNASKKSNGYNPGFVGRPYNPEKAKRLLTEAGYPNGLKLLFVSINTPQDRDAMALIQRYLKKVGIDAEIQFKDRGGYYAAANRGLKNAIIVFGQSIPLNLTLEHSGMFMKKSPRLPLMFRPPELQKAIGEAERTPDYDRQVLLTKKAVRIISEEAVMIPLWLQAVVNVTHTSVRDVNYSQAWRYQWTPENAWLSE
jgi:ABC-type transport system substrate-binding protein